jgi:3-phenylpropionate/cinnamic acid dioxygenase small subunit
VDLFAGYGTYVIEAISSEIGQQMRWMELDRSELAALFKEYPQHVRDPAIRTHLVTVDEIDATGDPATAVSSFAVFRTDPHGQSTLYAVGSYEDELVMAEGTWKLRRRKVRLDTRQLATPTPLPL